MAEYAWNGLGLKNPTNTALVQRLPTQMQTSPFTGATRTIARNGGFWEYTLNWRNLPGAERQAIIGWFARLHGAEHRARLPMFGELNRGAWGGTPLVNGALTSGHSANIDGCTPSQTNFARAGDLFRFFTSKRLRMITADADTDGGGATTLEFWPPIVETVADGIAVNPNASANAIQGNFILAAPLQVSTRDELASGDLTSDLTITLIDDVLGE